MTQKVRFLTIVALGFSVLTGTAALQLADSAPTSVVVFADGTAAPDAVTGGQPAPVPAPAGTPIPIPTGTQGTWGWG
ncbi:hypothetical protein ACIRBX_08670 [Kitasatospora sp. NPDC096147]|uniref:hypothetical protein n=1 Tax=Kitasatospora sp. NPDC096147 TaxID=3364093 RepID=UPI003826D3D0